MSKKPDIKYLTLYELTLLIKETIDITFSEYYWVIAEISELRLNQKGHCYLELIEKRDDIIVAQVRGNIWAYDYRRLSLKFFNETGEALKEGIKMLFLVSVNFHEVYGLSFNIKDLDPTYTLGEMTRKKRETIFKLQQEGLIDLNKALSLPLVPQRIAIVSSPTAAGYVDFVDHLRKNEYGYAFYTKLFSAIMQGEEAEQSIINSIRKIKKEKSFFDLVVIVRGGGSQVDLSCFDSYKIASEIAKFPLPVITGIGHEKDDTVADMVAHTKMKTPTAVAEFIISGIRSFEERILEFRKQVIRSAEHILKDQNYKLNNTINKLIKSTQHILNTNKNKMELFIHRLLSSHRVNIARKDNKLYLIQKNLQLAINHLLIRHKGKLDNLEKALHLLDPSNILKRGYSITYFRNKSLKDTSKLENGFIITTKLYKGILESKIIKINDYNDGEGRNDEIQ
ncbi:MAG: exodeoxyribonuclease VII large subunit [Thermodesulfovibrionales bacterium]|nr:exodeoxyribonuclease VII large subunit [Thermodesulfovibrionales bacterium]